jgi:ABC-2 type transport system permease protein
MTKALIRLLAVASKEVAEVRRQPRLLASLLLGPFLILLLFGVGYQGSTPGIPTLLVVPPELVDDPAVATLRQSLPSTFDIREVTTDEPAAMRRLRQGEVRLVEVLPGDAQARVLRGEQAPIEFRYDEINPLEERWLRFATYVQTLQLNNLLVEGVTAQTQSQSAGVLEMLADARTRLATVGRTLEVADEDLLRGSLRRARDAVAALAASPAVAASAPLGASGERAVRASLSEVANDLSALEAAAARGSLAQERARIDRTAQRLAELEATVQQLSSVPAAVIVSPLEQSTTNLAGPPLDLMVFYAPGVMALILQHIALTVAALSLVRERLRGALELFAVTPVSVGQLLAGKYLGFILFTGLLGLLLLALMRLLNVPFLGDVWLWAALLVLFLLASLGIGFVISSLSTSESQAVQLSMLVLLVSIFFSGFFLPLESFVPPVRALSALLPLTWGILGFQAIMLRGEPPEPAVWLALAAIGLITAAWVRLRWGRRNALG